MNSRIINRYLIREISGIFLLSLFIFTLVLLMGRMVKLMEMVVANGVPFLEVINLIVLLLPSFFVLTIPMALLLAVLLAFGRLSADNEITVMKSSGISLYQLAKPVLICGVSASLLTLLVSLFAVPWGSMGFKQLSVALARKYAATAIKERIFRDDIPGIVMYVDSYNESTNRMKRVMIQDGRDQQRQLTIFANEGVATSEEDNGALRILLKHGSIHTQGKEGEYRQIAFGEYMLLVDAGKMAPIMKTELDMGVKELYSMSHGPAASVPQIRNKLLTELHGRFVFPSAAIIFGLLAMPLGLQNRRSGKTSGYAMSILILLTYYIMLSFLKTFAEKGGISPAIAMWTPNLLFMLIALFMFRLAIIEKGIAELIPFAGRWRK